MTKSYEAHLRAALDQLIARMDEARASEGGQWVEATSRVLDQLDPDMRAAAHRKLRGLLSRDLPQDADTLARLRRALVDALAGRGYRVDMQDTVGSDETAIVRFSEAKKAVTLKNGLALGATVADGPIAEQLAMALAKTILIADLPEGALSSPAIAETLRWQAQALAWAALRDAGVDALNLPAQLAYGNGDGPDGRTVRSWARDLAPYYPELMGALASASGGSFGAIPDGAAVDVVAEKGAEDDPAWAEVTPDGPFAGQRIDNPTRGLGSDAGGETMARLFREIGEMMAGQTQGGGAGGASPAGRMDLSSVYGRPVERALRTWVASTDALIESILDESERTSELARSKQGNLSDGEAARSFGLIHLAHSVGNADMIVKAAVRAALLGEGMLGGRDGAGDDNDEGGDGHAA